MPKSKDKRSLETSSDDDFAPKPRSASEEMPPPAPEASTSNVPQAPRLNKAIWEYYDLVAAYYQEHKLGNQKYGATSG